MCMSDLGNSLDIYYIRVRISKSLYVNCFGIFLDGSLYFIQIKNIYKGGLYAVCRKSMLQQVEGSAVNIFCRYDMVTALCQVLNGVGNCCCTGSNCQSCNAAFQSCNSLFKYIFRRISQTSVNVSCICKTKSCCCVIAVTEYIRRCLIDWHCAGIRYRIRAFLSYMKLKGLKFEFSVCSFQFFCHGSVPHFIVVCVFAIICRSPP